MVNEHPYLNSAGKCHAGSCSSVSLQEEFADFVAQVDKSGFAVQKALDELNATTKKILNQELGLGNV